MDSILYFMPFNVSGIFQIDSNQSHKFDLDSLSESYNTYTNIY